MEKVTVIVTDKINQNKETNPPTTLNDNTTHKHKQTVKTAGTKHTQNTKGADKLTVLVQI